MKVKLRIKLSAQDRRRATIARLEEHPVNVIDFPMAEPMAGDSLWRLNENLLAFEARPVENVTVCEAAVVKLEPPRK